MRTLFAVAFGLVMAGAAKAQPTREQACWMGMNLCAGNLLQYSEFAGSAAAAVSAAGLGVRYGHSRIDSSEVNELCNIVADCEVALLDRPVDTSLIRSALRRLKTILRD